MHGKNTLVRMHLPRFYVGAYITFLAYNIRHQCKYYCNTTWYAKISTRKSNNAIAQGNLIIIRGVSLDAVSHEESVGAGRDKGMSRSHNLKAQETERTQ